MTIIVNGRIAIISAGTSNVDTSFEDINFNSIINIPYNILRPNSHIDVSEDCYIEIQNIEIGNSGMLQLNLLTGSEAISLNGAVTFTKPTIPGNFIINYTRNIGGLISFY